LNGGIITPPLSFHPQAANNSRRPQATQIATAHDSDAICPAGLRVLLVRSGERCRALLQAIGKARLNFGNSWRPSDRALLSRHRTEEFRKFLTSIKSSASSPS